MMMGRTAATNGSTNRILDRLDHTETECSYEHFDAREYLRFLGRNSLRGLIACAVAGVLALGVSLLMPKKYTATATLLIDAPSATDPRTSMAVSPIYLESLKSYELFAESDSLFEQALQKFNLRSQYPGAAVDSLKRRVLKVIKPLNTRILQVSATLRNPAKAQALTQYIAEQTVSLSLTLSHASDQELIDEAQRQLELARTKFHQLENAMLTESSRQPYEALQAEVDNLVELRTRLHREMLDSKVDAADYQAQDKRSDVVSAKARADVLEKQIVEIDRDLAIKAATASERREHLDQLSSDLKAARSTFLTAETRLNDLHASAGMRGERLRIVDPGLVPQRPSSPNIALNIAAAIFVAAVCMWVYLTLVFNLRTTHRQS